MTGNEQRINEMLTRDFGSTPDGRPLFRLVWSDDQFEHRRGTFSDFYGLIFIRTVTEVRQVKKYPLFPHEWVLEKWFGPEIAANQELPDSFQGSYEPVMVFRHENGQSVPVTETIVKHIIWCLFHPKRAADQASDDKHQDKIDFEKEVNHNFEVLADAGSPLKVDGKAII
jgi:hypothetical protein